MAAATKYHFVKDMNFNGNNYRKGEDHVKSDFPDFVFDYLTDQKLLKKGAAPKKDKEGTE